MTMRRSLAGTIIGITVAVIWQVLGGEALLWALALGLVGGLVGYVLDNPARLKEFAERLER